MSFGYDVTSASWESHLLNMPIRKKSGKASSSFCQFLWNIHNKHLFPKVTGSVVLASDVAMPLCSNSTIIGGNCVLCMTALIRFTVFSSNNLFWGVNFEILPLISKTHLLDQWHRLPPDPLGYFAFPRCWQTTTRNWVNLMKCELCRRRG